MSLRVHSHFLRGKKAPAEIRLRRGNSSSADPETPLLLLLLVTKLVLGNALAGEAVLPMEGASAGGSRHAGSRARTTAFEAKLRRQVRDQAQLGQEKL